MGACTSSSAVSKPDDFRDSRSTIIDAPTDCFLTHNWADGNHVRVQTINKALQKRGLRTWFDDDRMKGQIYKTMARGIENTSSVVVFITRLYMDKVNGDDERDNCQLEFAHAVRQLGPQKMVPVVMDKDMRDPKLWKGQLGLHLGSHLFVDFSCVEFGTEAFDQKVKSLETAIRERATGFPVASVDVVSKGKFQHRRSITTHSNPLAESRKEGV